MGAMTTRTPADVVVVGGGVIGLAIAWRAASSDMAVTVVDPDPGQGASWAAAGMLAPVGEAHFGEDALTRLNLAAARTWPGFARDLEQTSGRRVHYRTGGTLLVAVDASDRAATDDVLHYQQALGLTARRLTSTAVPDAEPLLAPGIRGGVELAEDHQVDNRQVVEALLDACRTAGVTFVGTRSTRSRRTQVGATGVSLRCGGRLGASAVVLAAGCHSGRIGGVPRPMRPPVRPVKGLTLRLRALDRCPEAAADRSRAGAGPELLPGPTVRTARWWSEPRSRRRGSISPCRPGSVFDLLDDARRLIPTLDEYELCETTTGLRPGSPDNAPIVGSTGLPGLLVATGHFRNGILLAPITAEEVVRLLTLEVGSAPGRAGHPRTAVAPGGAGPAGGADRERGETAQRGPIFAAFGPSRFPPGPEQGGVGSPAGAAVEPMSAIVVNGQPWDGPPGTTVAELVSAWCPSPKGIAVARNGEVVPKSTWDDTG